MEPFANVQRFNRHFEIILPAAPATPSLPLARYGVADDYMLRTFLSYEDSLLKALVEAL